MYLKINGTNYHSIKLYRDKTLATITYTGESIMDVGELHNIEDLLRSTISNVNVLKYDKDIDISKIVDHTHIVISDRQENIYLVS